MCSVEHVRPTVLVIDDDADFGQLISLVIEGAGCRPIIALDGMFGLGVASEISPSLILCDCSMPGLSGEEIMRLLQDDPALADVPRVLMSGYGCPDLRKIPADAFIAKPINTQSLRRLIRAFTKPRNNTAVVDGVPAR
jgi:CheY-like chemotaxis protein